MKKTLLLTLALLLSTAMFAQTRAILLNESFETTAVPAGWEVYNGGGSNWSIRNTSKAGGEPCELEFYWDPIFVGVSYLSMGAFDLSGINSLAVSFKHYYERYYGNPSSIGIATSSDGGANWNTAWTMTYEETGQYVVDENITSPDFGKNNVKIALFYNGDSNDINYWYFDDIMLFSQEAIDANIVEINVNDNLGIGKSEVAFTIKNIGTSSIESLEATYQVEGFDMVTEEFEVNLASFEETTLTFEEVMMLFPGEYVLSVNITKVNGTDDDYTDNNAAEKELIVGKGIAQRQPMIEHFSSSTCYPCVATNSDMAALTAANPGKFTYTKYPMNGPGTGDPYYTNECGTRRSFYGVQYVPTVFIDGQTVELPLTQEKFNERYNTSTFVNIRGAYTIEGNTINVIADFMSYVDLNNVKAYISVNEKTTTENVGNNGETEFHHIMMKMLQSAQGNTISIAAGEYKRLEFSYDMSSTNVEEMNDLEVSLWLQHGSTKEVYNSIFAYENAEHAYPVENMDAIIDGDYVTLSIGWEAPEQGNPIGYNIYVNGELLEENYTDLHYSNDDLGYLYETIDDRENVAEVVAVYEDGKTSVGVAKVIGRATSIEESATADFVIYPNPAKDFVKVSTVNGQRSTVNGQQSTVNSQLSAVRVYNCLGMLVEEIEFNGNEIEINTSDYNTGIYFIDIQTENGNVVKKMIVE